MNLSNTTNGMPNSLDILIEKYSTDDNKLSCSNAFKIASKLKLEPIAVGERAQKRGVRITACELGQFGKQPLGEFKHEVLKDLEAACDSQRRIYCAAAREIAKKSNLKAVRTAIRRGDIDVLYCQLGCFTAKKRTKLYVKTKTWIEENQNRTRLFGKGKTELLELIAEYGSISKAAEVLHMSKERAWEHIEELRKNLDDVLVQTDDTNKLTLSPVAKRFIKNFRILQDDIEAYANKRFKELFPQPKKQ